jgi:nitrate reductase delta subunit
MTRRGARERAGRATVYKLCSLALQYPDQELVAGRVELARAAAELPRSASADALVRFFEWFLRATPLELAQHYVKTFDLHKRSALYLTFYSLGDRRDRGLALVRLKKLYRAAGFPLGGSELPDYLPVMLEFAAAVPPEKGELVLSEHRPALELVRLALHDQESPYAHPLDAVCEQVGRLSAAERMGLDRLIEQGPPRELVGLEPFAPPEVMPSTGARR